MRRLATLAVLGMLGTALLVSGSHSQSQTQGTEGRIDLNRQFTKIGGIYIDGNGDTVLVRARYSASGTEQSDDIDRDRDYTQYANVASNITVAAEGSFQTDFFPAEEYTSFQVFVSWTVADTGATNNRDSIAILLVPFAKTSSTDDGVNYIINQSPASVDSLWNHYVPGILVTTSRNPNFVANGGFATTSGYRPTRVVIADLEGFSPRMAHLGFRWLSGSPMQRLATFTLGGQHGGGDIKAPFIGFYVFNLSQTVAAANVTIDIWAKVN